MQVDALRARPRGDYHVALDRNVVTAHALDAAPGARVAQVIGHHRARDLTSIDLSERDDRAGLRTIAYCDVSADDDRFAATLDLYRNALLGHRARHHDGVVLDGELCDIGAEDAPAQHDVVRELAAQQRIGSADAAECDRRSLADVVDKTALNHQVRRPVVARGLEVDGRIAKGPVPLVTAWVKRDWPTPGRAWGTRPSGRRARRVRRRTCPRLCRVG